MKIELVDIHFWILHILFTLGIIAGILYRISIVLQGATEEFGEPYRISRWKKFWHYAGLFFKTFFSKKFVPIMKIIILDVILHAKLFKESKLKWFVHTCLFWGILILFILSVLSGVAVEIAPALGYKVGASQFLDGLASKDNWVTALLNEILNVIILIGVVFAFVRGFITKKKIGMMLFQDIFLIIFIIAILITGWFTESTRYIIEHTPAYIGSMGFFGFDLSRLLVLAFPRAVDAIWVIWYKIFWHAHVTIIWLAFLYIPFSKFSHALLSPVASVINVMEKKKFQS
jgi:nitrate reductase gamma subunit